MSQPVSSAASYDSSAASDANQGHSSGTGKRHADAEMARVLHTKPFAMALDSSGVSFSSCADGLTRSDAQNLMGSPDCVPFLCTAHKAEFRGCLGLPALYAAMGRGRDGPRRAGARARSPARVRRGLARRPLVPRGLGRRGFGPSRARAIRQLKVRRPHAGEGSSSKRFSVRPARLAPL